MLAHAREFEHVGKQLQVYSRSLLGEMNVSYPSFLVIFSFVRRLQKKRKKTQL